MILTMNKPQQYIKIAILGGSFNPPHLAHQLMALCLLATRDIDELWIMPCADHPFKKSLVTFDHRFNMCQIAFRHFSKKVIISDIENKLSKPNFTVNTLEYILKKQPKTNITLAFGSDILSEIKNWYMPEKLSKLANIIIFPRKNPESITLPREISNAQVASEIILPAISSSNIREGTYISSHVDNEIKEYIKTNKLYIS
jgi:nicotinate-nucleotide adenylyltransferase